MYAIRSYYVHDVHDAVRIDLGGVRGADVGAGGVGAVLALARGEALAEVGILAAQRFLVDPSYNFV